MHTCFVVKKKKKNNKYKRETKDTKGSILLPKLTYPVNQKGKKNYSQIT